MSNQREELVVIAVVFEVCEEEVHFDVEQQV
jgi:hypothetical protein